MRRRVDVGLTHHDVALSVQQSDNPLWAVLAQRLACALANLAPVVQHGEGDVALLHGVLHENDVGVKDLCRSVSERSATCTSTSPIRTRRAAVGQPVAKDDAVAAKQRVNAVAVVQRQVLCRRPVHGSSI